MISIEHDEQDRESRQRRAAAEAQVARDLPAATDARPAEELLHELQVHQIELEMQNEALRQAQIDLEASRDRYADLYEFAPVGYLTLDANGMIAEINLTGATLLGTDRKQSLRRRFTSFVSPEGQDRWMLHFLDAIRRDGRSALELVLKRGDGSFFDARLDCMPVKVATKVGADDAAIRIALTDVSEGKQAEARRLDYARRQRDTLVREVHHRIKNNLQSVAGLLHRELGRFVEHNPRLEAAISQINAIAVVHGLQSVAPDEAIGLCNGVKSICESVASLSRRPVHFHMEGGHPDACPVRVENSEAVSIALVVNELVFNAVKHSPHDSVPTVSLSTDGGSAQLHIRNALTAAHAFDIDTGAGLGTGLRLVRSLLPEQGARLTHALDEEGFLLTRLDLMAPVVMKQDDRSGESA